MKIMHVQINEWGMIYGFNKKMLLILSVMILTVFILIALFLFGDYLLYNHSVSTKEEAFEMLKNNQEEYELLVQKMEDLFNESNEYSIKLNGKHEYKENQLNSEILKQYPVRSISVKSIEGNYKVSFHLAFPPNPNNYWGSYFIYKTEKMKDNWYYYECCTR